MNDANEIPDPPIDDDERFEDPRDGPGVYVPASHVKHGGTEVIQAPSPPPVSVDPRTGDLPAGWRFADE